MAEIEGFPEDFNAANEQTQQALDELDARSAEPVEETPETDTVEEGAEEAKEAETTSAEETEPKKDPIPAEQFKGMLDEREKRQAAERELRDLRDQLESQKKDDPLADPLEDAPKYAEQIMERAEERILEVRAEMFNMQRTMMRRLHEDWDEAETWFTENVGSNVAMKAAVQGADDVFDSVYKMWTDHKKLEEAQDIESLTERIRAEEREKLRAEMGQEAEKAEANTAATSKPSLARAGSSASVDKPGILSLEDVFGTDFNDRPK